MRGIYGKGHRDLLQTLVENCFFTDCVGKRKHEIFVNLPG